MLKKKMKFKRKEWERYIKQIVGSESECKKSIYQVVQEGRNLCVCAWHGKSRSENARMIYLAALHVL